MACDCEGVFRLWNEGLLERQNVRKKYVCVFATWKHTYVLKRQDLGGNMYVLFVTWRHRYMCMCRLCQVCAYLMTLPVWLTCLLSSSKRWYRFLPSAVTSNDATYANSNDKKYIFFNHVFFLTIRIITASFPLDQYRQK